MSVALVLCATSAAPMQALAQQPTAEPVGYREAIDEAVHEFESAHFPEARAMFERAHRLYPNARTWRGIGMAEFELRNYPACTSALDAALASEERPLAGPLRADTEELLARSNTFVSRVAIDTKPAAAQVKVDGLSVAIPAGQPLLLSIGEHDIEVEAPGHAPAKRHVSARGGETTSLTIVMMANQPAPERSPVASAQPQARRPLIKSPWLWTAAGVVVAGAITGAVLASNGASRETESPYGGSSHAVVGGP